MPKTYNVQDWIKGEMQSFSISDNGDEKTGRDPVVVAEVFVNEDLGQSQEEAEAQAVDLASLFAKSPAILKALIEVTAALKDIVGAADNQEPYTRDELASEFAAMVSDSENLIEEITA